MDKTLIMTDVKSKAADDSSGFVVLTDVVPDVILEMRYHSTFNFVGRHVPGYDEPIALLTREAAVALKQASESLRRQGYLLKVFDAYRPQCAVDFFMQWADNPDDTLMKQYFYPEVEKTEIVPSHYLARKSGHTRGSTIDVTLFDMRLQRDADMGCTFDYFGEMSHPGVKPGVKAGAYPSVLTPEQYANRMTLRKAMTDSGFNPLASEWWHFSLADEPYPDTYFTFPVKML